MLSFSQNKVERAGKAILNKDTLLGLKDYASLLLFDAQEGKCFYLSQFFSKNIGDHGERDFYLKENKKLRERLKSLDKLAEESQLIIDELSQKLEESQKKYQELLEKFDNFDLDLKKLKEEIRSRESFRFIWPVSLRALNATALTDQYRKKLSRRERLNYQGIDIAAFPNSPVVSIESGKVECVRQDRFGRYSLIINHGSIGEFQIKSEYHFLLEVMVQQGDYIKSGKIIGLVGSQVNDQDFHLHFEMRVNDKPVNPLEYLSPAGKTFWKKDLIA